jgi:hypothetical protein
MTSWIMGFLNCVLQYTWHPPFDARPIGNEFSTEQLLKPRFVMKHAFLEPDCAYGEDE